jgi:hypothetical protein
MNGGKLTSRARTSVREAKRLKRRDDLIRIGDIHGNSGYFGGKTPQHGIAA